MDPQSSILFSGPPYLPNTASLGGQPTLALDIPVTAIFLFLFLCGAVWHMAIFQLNRRRGHKFLISVFLFYLCFIRLATCILRIVWGTRLTNARIAIAATILVSAGVLILFVINLILAQRIARALLPEFGWNTWVSRAWIALYICVPALLIMTVTVSVQSFFTLDTNTLRIDRDVQLFAATFLAVISFAPLPILLACLIISRKPYAVSFGYGSMASKIIILLISTVLLAFGAAFRAGIAHVPRPRSDPAWYHSKACFYILNFAVEIVVVYLYAGLRVDQRFYVPDKDKRENIPGAYGYVSRKLALDSPERSKGLEK